MKGLLLDAYAAPGELNNAEEETPIGSVEQYAEDDISGNENANLSESFAEKYVEEEDIFDKSSELTEFIASAVSSQNSGKSESSESSKNENKESTNETEETKTESKSDESVSSAESRTSAAVSTQSYIKKADNAKTNFLVITVFAAVVIAAAAAIIIRVAKRKK